MSDTNLKGEISEAKIVAALISCGYKLVYPHGVERWDFGWDDDGTIIKIQCKTGRVIHGAIRFKTSNQDRSGNRNDYRKHVHYFAVYVAEIDMAYLIPVTAVGVNEGYLRISRPKNNQKTKILWARDYEIKSPLRTQE